MSDDARDQEVKFEDRGGAGAADAGTAEGSETTDKVVRPWSATTWSATTAETCGGVHLLAVLCGCIALAIKLCTPMLGGTFGLLMALSSNIYPVMIPATLATFAPAALIAAAIADARHASALLMSAAGVYGTAAAALVGLGIPFASVSAVVVGAVCGLMCWLGLSAAKVAHKDER